MWLYLLSVACMASSRQRCRTVGAVGRWPFLARMSLLQCALPLEWAEGCLSVCALTWLSVVCVYVNMCAPVLSD